ncbi:MAG: hypothetical protein Q9160_004349 [Pyrenula sp. 1 TL-2023]
MPSAKTNRQSTNRITKFNNCRLVKDKNLVSEDLWVDSITGKILDSQSAFYGDHRAPDQTIDLKNRILAPGFIDVQVNGAQGFDFSVPQDDPEAYKTGLSRVNQHFMRNGVTSYLPTVTSQKQSVYHAVLPHLGPSGASRDPWAGAESLGAHVEGPYMSPCRNGIHNQSVLLKPSQTNPLDSLSATYGASNLFPQPNRNSPSALPPLPPHIKKITSAPELYSPETLPAVIATLRANNQIFSIGHTDADHNTASAAVAAGANMITHLFNAMRPFNHRDPGVFGLLANPPSSSATPSPSSSTTSTPRSSLSISRSSSTSSPPHSSQSPSSPSKLQRPYFGLIADLIHLSPAALSLAHSAHPHGTILVTDAMPLSGLPDGLHPWTNGETIIKTGKLLRLATITAEKAESVGEGEGRIAGSVVELIDCVNAFIKATGVGVAEAVGCVTAHPAEMLGGGVAEGKGRLEVGRDADLVVLDDGVGEEVKVAEVWKFGVRVFNAAEEGGN